MKILTFAPHPDDEIIGCGGYLAKLIGQNNSVEVAFMISLDEVRTAEVSEVSAYMGFESTYFLNQGVGRFAQKTQDLFQEVLNTIRSSQPDMILTPHKNEQDKDHQLLTEVVLESAYLCESDFLLEDGQRPCSVTNILGYEVWTPISNPNLVVDISDTIDTKIQAMKLYPSQGSRRFVSMFTGLNQYRAAVTNKGTFAEGFEVYKLGEKNIF